MIAPEEVPACVTLLFLAVALQASSGLPMLFPGPIRQRFCVLLMTAGSLAGVAGSLLALIFPTPVTYLLEWSLPFGPAEIGIDPLSAIFLLAIFIVTGCSAVYSVGYWPAAAHSASIRRLTLFTGLLAASLALVVMARDGILFLLAWEIMALSAYFTLIAEDDKPEVRDAGTLYLVTTHIGTLALFALFALLSGASGDYAFPAPSSLTLAGPLSAVIFFVALFGFGLKAGMMPLHVWLPSAHANAPSHISAILSSVVLKTGIYGMLRVFSFFSTVPIWWGCVLLALGAVSAVIGVAFAIGQHDLKRLLAYHSIENIGIILIGIGVALVGQATGHPAMMLLGMAGALLHVFNHATFKALLFLGAGSVIHACGTREIDLMGGVGRRLPWTAAFFLVGAAAICGLPPLNGFVSELFIYLGCFRAIQSHNGIAGVSPAMAAPALALVGGLALACFVKVCGVVFLGTPRSGSHATGHEAPVSMLAPMGLLAAVCLLIGMAPWLPASPLHNAILSWHPALAVSGVRLASLAPLAWISYLGIGLACSTAAVAIILARRSRKLPRAVSDTWGCGYSGTTARMQYSSSSFAEMLVTCFRGFLRPKVHHPTISGAFPAPSRFSSHVPETVLEQIYIPFFEYLYDKSAPIRRLQHGQVNIYLLYSFVTLVLLMVLTI
jgi:formate hydrogenlyase subunit 3/multisubunit Na+/H+ antiporter MnhD subunit